MRRLATLIFLAVLMPVAASAQRVGIIGTTVPATSVAPPSAPTGFSPACGATGVSTTPTLSFTSSGATSYTIAFNTFSPPTTIVATTNSYAPIGLTLSTTYYWVATGINATASTFSSPCAFTTVSGGAGEDDIVAGAAACADPADDSPTGRNPRFIWTCARQHIWNQMKADYLANPSSPATRGGQWYKLTRQAAEDGRNVACANGTPPYVNIGQWAAHMYQWTGDQMWADEAWRRVDCWWNTFTPFPGTDPNLYREWATMHVIMLDWLWPGLTTDQRVEFLEKTIAQTAGQLDVYIANNQGYPLGDHDQFMGVYFPVVMLHLNHPGNTEATRMYNHPRTGGVISTGSNHNTTARNSITQMIGMAAGGEFIETNEYNPGTMSLLMEGVEAITTFTGIDYFPEVTAWYPDAAKAYYQRFMPSLDVTVEYLDEQTPYQIDLKDWGNAVPMLAGLIKTTTPGKQLQQLIIDLEAKYGLSYGGMFASVYGRGPYLYDPYASAVPWKVDKSYYSSGYGFQIQREGFATNDALYFALAGRRITDSLQGTWWPDHMPHNLLDVQLWTQNAHSLTHPFGYGASNSMGDGTNTMLIHGMGDAFEYKDVVAESHSDTYAFLEATTAGSFLEKFYAQAPTVLHEYTRAALYVSGTVDVIILWDRTYADDIAGGDLTTYPCAASPCPDPDHGGSYYDQISRKRARKQWIFHMPVNPTVVGDVLTWNTNGTQKAKWTVLTPTGLTKNHYDELVDLAQPSPPRYGWSLQGNYYDTSLKHQIQLFSNNTWDAWLNVFEVHPTTTPITPTLVQDAGKVNCAHVVRTGESDVLACGNSTQSAALNTTAYHATHAAAIPLQHYRSTGFTIGYTASNGTTRWFLADLDPAKTWTYTLDGGSSKAITAEADGFAEVPLTVSAGAHTLVVTGT